MKKVAEIVWKECFGIAPKEKALVVCDPDGERLEIGKALLEVGKKLCDCRLMRMERTGMAGREPKEKDIIQAMLEVDAVVAPTEFSITHTKAVTDARNAGARVITMPGILKDTFFRVIPIDYNELDKMNRGIIDVLKRGKQLRMTTRAGTDMYMEIMSGRKICNDNGLTRRPGELNNLPSGEVAIAPRERKSEGTLVIDLSAPFTGVVKKPFKIKVDGGEVVDCEEPKLWKALTNVENGTNLAELGIGTNPKAKIIGNILEDEKVLKTAHIAFGTSKALGGNIQSSIHLDSVFNKPTIEVDGKEVIKEGKLL